MIKVSGATYSDTNVAGTTSGTFSYNNPWTGLVTYHNTSTAASGVADIATVGAFTFTNSAAPCIFLEPA